MNYIDAIRKTAKRIEAGFEESELVTHNLSKGIARENIIKKCIRPFLPDAYGIASGECFDINGNMSKQLDVVVYDKLFSYIVPYTDDFIQFPFESVYGNIEVKSNLTGDELRKAIENIKSLKQLIREKPSDAQILPNRSIEIKGVTWSEIGTSEPFGIIFGYKSLKPDTIIEHLCQIPSEQIQFLPNMIVLYEERTIILRLKYYPNGSGKEGWYPNFYGDYDGFMPLPCGEDTLPIFITNVLIHSSHECLNTLSIENLINPIIDKALRNMPPSKVARYK
ncbi:MAG: hypothetical protein NC416_15220 [Eubacterium sp.]|nr:hypothetical protein [Eubacterium sp.]